MVDKYTLLMLFFVTAPNDTVSTHKQKDNRIWSFQSSTTMQATDLAWCRKVALSMRDNIAVTDTMQVVAYCIPKDANTLCSDNANACARGKDKIPRANPADAQIERVEPRDHEAATPDKGFAAPAAKSLDRLLRAF